MSDTIIDRRNYGELFVWEVKCIDEEGNQTELIFPVKREAFDCVGKLLNTPELTYLSLARRLG